MLTWPWATQPPFWMAGKVHGYKLHVGGLPPAMTPREIEDWAQDLFDAHLIARPSQTNVFRNASPQGTQQCVWTWEAKFGWQESQHSFAWRSAVQAQLVLNGQGLGGKYQAEARFWYNV